jgi:hypothetical protein
LPSTSVQQLRKSGPLSNDFNADPSPLGEVTSLSTAAAPTTGAFPISTDAEMEEIMALEGVVARGFAGVVAGSIIASAIFLVLYFLLMARFHEHRGPVVWFEHISNIFMTVCSVAIINLFIVGWSETWMVISGLEDANHGVMIETGSSVLIRLSSFHALKMRYVLPTARMTAPFQTIVAPMFQFRSARKTNGRAMIYHGFRRCIVPLEFCSPSPRPSWRSA